MGSPETGKFSTALRVSAPQSSVCPVTSVMAQAEYLRARARRDIRHAWR